MCRFRAPAAARELRGLRSHSRQRGRPDAVARAYRLFAGKAASRTVAAGAVANGDGVANGSTGAGNPRHIEYLVDRFGLLRSRATGLPGAQQSDAMLAKVETLARETREPPALWAHRH